MQHQNATTSSKTSLTARTQAIVHFRAVNVSGEKWSRDDEMLLIELVSFHKCLYDASSEKYKDLIVKNNVWKQIAEKMEGKSDEDCKRRWRSIRDTYKKLKREGKLGTGSAAIGKAKWPLLKYLSFLENVSEGRRTITNIFDDSEESTAQDIPDNKDGDTQDDKSQNIENIEEVENDDSLLSPASVASTPSTSRVGTKRKVTSTNEITELLEINRKSREKLINNFLEKNSSENDDDVNTFYKSIAMSVKKLPPHLIRTAKIKHLEVLNELEIEATQQKNIIIVNQLSMDCSSNIRGYQSQSSSHNQGDNFPVGQNSVIENSNFRTEEVEVEVEEDQEIYA